MKKAIFNSYSLVIVLFYTAMLFWWILLFIKHSINTKENYVFGLAIGLLSVIGSLIGIFRSKKWNFFKSVISKSVLFLSLGILTWGIGTVIFAYYNLYLNIEVPYPSLADAAYIISWPLWVIGMFYFLKVLGVKYRLKNTIGKLFLVIIPLVAIVISYYLLFIVARGGLINFSNGNLKLFFDLAYPIGDIVIITFTVLIYSFSLNYLGGLLKWPIFIILSGFVINYIGDFSFVYTATKETYFVANWVDLIYTTAFFLLGLGLSLLNPSLLNNIRQKSDGLLETPDTDISDACITGVVSILQKIILTIIKRQERIAGQIAWEEAKDVPGLTVINQQKEEISLNDNSIKNFKKTIDELVGKYKKLFGDLAVDVSKDATKHLLSELQNDQIPDSLK